MAKFQLIVSDPKNRISKATTLEGAKAQALVGKSIGEEVDGKLLGIGSLKVRITGGTDKDGIPMRFDIQGSAKKKAVLSGGVGYKPQNKGQRVRRLLRGRTVSEDTLQINSVITSGELEKVEKTEKTEKQDVAEEAKA
jgi:small subunit ribosomal protein S6e